jgi:hypothetical protein
MRCSIVCVILYYCYHSLDLCLSLSRFARISFGSRPPSHGTFCTVLDDATEEVRDRGPNAHLHRVPFLYNDRDVLGYPTRDEHACVVPRQRLKVVYVVQGAVEKVLRI